MTLQASIDETWQAPIQKEKTRNRPKQAVDRGAAN